MSSNLNLISKSIYFIDYLHFILLFCYFYIMEKTKLDEILSQMESMGTKKPRLTVLSAILGGVLMGLLIHHGNCIFIADGGLAKSKQSDKLLNQQEQPVIANDIELTYFKAK